MLTNHMRIKCILCFCLSIWRVAGQDVNPVPLVSQNASDTLAELHFSEGGSFAVSIDGTFAPGTVFQWFRNDVALNRVLSNAQTLMWSPATPSDVGLYYATVTLGGGPSFVTQSFIAYIDPQPRIVNSSMLVMVRGSDRPATFGFVAPPSPYDKHLLIRAVGPGLKLFGLTNLLSQPTLKIIDSAGKEAVFAGGSDSNSNPFVVQAEAKSGAFPLPDHSKDLAGIFVASNGYGAYTIQVGSADGTDGYVLLEVYEIPY